MERTIKFEENSLIPTITFPKKEKFNLGYNNNSENTSNDTTRNVNVSTYVNCLVIENCNLTIGSEISSTILKLLTKGTNKNCNHISTTTTTATTDKTYFDTIDMDECDGDEVIFKEIMEKANVKKLIIRDGRRPTTTQKISSGEKQMGLHDSIYWRPLCQILSSPTTNTRLTTIHFYATFFTPEAIQILSNEYEKQQKQPRMKNSSHDIDNEDGNDNDDGNEDVVCKTICKIREILFYAVTFLDKSYLDLANVIHRYISPSLRSLKIEEPHGLSDEQLSKFLSPILLTRQETSITSTTVSSSSSSSSTSTIIGHERGDDLFFPSEELRLDRMMYIGNYTMSVIAKWLQPTLLPSISHYTTETFDAIAISDNDAKDLYENSHRGDNNDNKDNNNATNPCAVLSSSSFTAPSPTSPHQRYHHRRSLMICHLDVSLNVLRMLHLEDEFLKALSISKLKELKFRFENKLPDEEMSKFVIALRSCQQYLKVVDFSGWDLSKYPASLVGELLQSIVGSSSSPKGGSAFLPVSDDGQEYNERHPLTQLDVSSCKLNDENVRFISEQLHHLTKLQTLNLGYNQTFSNDCIIHYLLPALETKHVQLVKLKDLILYGFHDAGYSYRIAFITDLNRGGHQFLLQKDQYQQRRQQQLREKQEGESTNADQYGMVCKTSYPRAVLWPLIFHHVNHIMSLPTLDQNVVTYQNYVKRYFDFVLYSNTRRRSSIIYYFLLHGAVIDCISEQEEHK